MQALNGITVLDLARGYPPAHSAMILADFGARVIKVDPPAGGRMRKPEGIDTEGEWFAASKRGNRNKETVVINLQSEEGLKVLYRLVKKADVLIEGFRPGVMKKLHADYDTLKAINPRLIYCAENGYGSDGPYANIPGHDPCYLSIAGAMSMIGPRDGAPTPPSNYLGDMAGGALHGLIGILIALIAREKTGLGQAVDISYTDGVMSLMDGDVGNYLMTGKYFQRGQTFSTGATTWSHEYKCKDGGYFSVGCGEPHLWENLCRAIGREDLLPYHKAPLQEQEAGIKALGEVFITKTRKEWWDLLKDKNTCVAPVNTVAEAVEDPQILHRKMVLEIDHPTVGKVKQIGFPIKLSETPAEIRYLGKVVGSDTQRIMKELGYSQEEVQKLRQEGAIR